MCIWIDYHIFFLHLNVAKKLNAYDNKCKILKDITKLIKLLRAVISGTRSASNFHRFFRLDGNEQCSAAFKSLITAEKSFCKLEQKENVLNELSLGCNVRTT